MSNPTLHNAIRNRNIESIRALLSQGVDVNEKEDDKYGRTPLHAAVVVRSKEIVELLIDAKADLNVIDNAGKTAYQCALDDRYSDLTRYFVEAGADVNAKNFRGQTPLHLAVANNDLDTTRYLLSKMADPKIVDFCGYTAFKIAMLNENLEMVKMLMDTSTTDLEYKNFKGLTAVQLAAMKDDSAFVELLRSLGADAGEYAVRVPLDYTWSSCCNLEIGKKDSTFSDELVS